VNLATQVERWNRFWTKTTDPAEVARPLKRLLWLEEFTFHCGLEITPQDFQALHEQLENGNTRLAELQSHSELTIEAMSVAKTLFGRLASK